MARKRSRTLIAFVVIATLMTLGWQASSVALAGSVVLTPLADASINNANPSINYGTTSPLHVDALPVVATYLRFNVASVQASSAVLSIVATSAQSTGFDVHALSDDTWAENALTWSNHPGWDPTVLGSSGPAVAGARLTINLPPASVSDRVNVDFVLTTSNQTALALASRESLNPPQLTITPTAPTPTPTPSPTPSPTAADPIVLTAGDIGCGLTNTGGMSPGGACQQGATANLLGAAGVAAVLPLGDNEYECGELSNFQSFYGPTWGQFKALTYPVVGNHEYLTAGGSTPCLNSETQVGAPGYFTYFGGAASPWTAAVQPPVGATTASTSAPGI